jgi:signal transduction histidine kinase
VRFTRWRIFASTELAIIALVLLAIVGLAGALGYQAQAASRANVATAEHALTHYSSVAAWQFTRAAQRELQMTAEAVIGSRVQRAMRQPGRDRQQLLAPAELHAAAGAPDCPCHGTLTPEHFFRWDAGAGDLVTDGPWPAAERRSLARRIAAEAAQPLGQFDWTRADCEVLFDHDSSGATHLIATVAVYDDERHLRAVYGITAPASEAAALLGRATRSGSLLPVALLSPAEQDSTVGISVLADRHVVFVQGPTRDARFAATDSLGVGAFGATVRVGLAPTAANRLLIGGVPRSRLPYIALFLVIAVALLAVALRQMHRTLLLVRLRSDFVASVSHELRTPLALIRVYTETLADEDPPESRQRQHFLGVILKECNRLSGLVDNLLRFAELERRALTLVLAPHDLAAVVESATADYLPLAASHGIEIESRLSHDLVAAVDASAIRQMLFNVLNNAVKYGPPNGRIVVSLSRAADRAQIMIDDQGPGIPPAQRRRVFERYVRLADVSGGAPAGSGIGLAIVRELAHAQRMSVWIDDAPGGGARVVLAVPLADVVPPPAGPAVQSAHLVES